MSLSADQIPRSADGHPLGRWKIRAADGLPILHPGVLWDDGTAVVDAVTLQRLLLSFGGRIDAEPASDDDRDAIVRGVGFTRLRDLALAGAPWARSLLGIDATADAELRAAAQRSAVARVARSSTPATGDEVVRALVATEAARVLAEYEARRALADAHRTRVEDTGIDALYREARKIGIPNVKSHNRRALIAAILDKHGWPATWPPDWSAPPEGENEPRPRPPGTPGRKPRSITAQREAELAAAAARPEGAETVAALDEAPVALPAPVAAADVPPYGPEDAAPDPGDRCACEGAKGTLVDGVATCTGCGLPLFSPALGAPLA